LSGKMDMKTTSWYKGVPKKKSKDLKESLKMSCMEQVKACILQVDTDKKRSQIHSREKGNVPDGN